jgi:hypothetical protein
MIIRRPARAIGNGHVRGRAWAFPAGCAAPLRRADTDGAALQAPCLAKWPLPQSWRPLERTENRGRQEVHRSRPEGALESLSRQEKRHGEFAMNVWFPRSAFRHQAICRDRDPFSRPHLFARGVMGYYLAWREWPGSPCSLCCRPFLPYSSSPARKQKSGFEKSEWFTAAINSWRKNIVSRSPAIHFVFLFPLLIFLDYFIAPHNNRKFSGKFSSSPIKCLGNGLAALSGKGPIKYYSSAQNCERPGNSK